MKQLKARRDAVGCSPKPALDRRPLIDLEKARGLAALFGVLASDTRLRLLHAIARKGDLCVSDIAAAVTMKPQAISNQLQRLADRRILRAQRNGTHVYYRIVDPCVTVLLERGLCLLEDAGGSGR